MVSFIKNLISKDSLIYRLTSFIYHIRRNVWLPPKFENLNLLVSKYASFKDYKNQPICFIQVGSNDGFSNDPIHAFVKKYQWYGICLEPVYLNFHNLNKTYVDCHHVKTIQAACGIDGEVTVYSINADKASSLGIDLPPWYNQLASLDRDLVISDIHHPKKSELLDASLVPSHSFVTLLKAEKLENVDLIHIDTEGADWEILKNFPFKKILPEIIIFEHNHISLIDYKAAVYFLRKRGYYLMRVNTDTICYLNFLGHLFSDIEKSYF